MKDDIYGLILIGIVFVMFLGLSAYMKSGRGAFLINMYVFMPKEKKALFDEKALCRFSGNLLLLADLFLIFMVIAWIFDAPWLILFLIIILILISIAATVYSFTDPKFRK